jgi:hypothetical protein
MNDRPKKQEEISRAAAIRQAFIDRQRATGNARSLMSQLEMWALEHDRALRAVEQHCSRLSEGVRRVISNGTVRCLSADPAVLATQLIAGRDLSEITSEQESSPDLQHFYASLNFTSGGRDMVTDPGDLELFKSWNRERAACTILQAAIRLHKKSMSAINSVSMEKFSRTVVQARVTTARQVLALLGQLRQIVLPDQDLATGLNKDEIAALRPRPFPPQILSSAALSWMMDAVAVGMIQAAEVTDLQPDVLSPVPAPKEGEPHLQCQM